MARAFAEIAFTPSVRAAQARNGSAEAYVSFLETPNTGGGEEIDDPKRGDRIGADEAAFISARDGFYQATVSENGWPYVQFRGGPAGFLKVLDEARIAYADFRGNRQYLSVGNLSNDDRVSLILMDYPGRRRLKIWGRARLIDAADNPALLASLYTEGYRAKPERAVEITIAAIDWNCPQHIPQRFTAEEIEKRLSPLREELERLKSENARLRAVADT